MRPSISAAAAFDYFPGFKPEQDDMQTLSLGLRSFFQKNMTKLRFCLLFVFFFFLGQLLYHHFRPTLIPYLVHRATAGVGSGGINLLAPGEATSARDAKNRPRAGVSDTVPFARLEMI
ncbi:MAG: hypothetical protein HQK60_14275 [Deltaproteobacteria bacterium]|nr:hypothetical protein [Deltaproteobacteria bacterium]